MVKEGHRLGHIGPLRLGGFCGTDVAAVCVQADVVGETGHEESGGLALLHGVDHAGPNFTMERRHDAMSVHGVPLGRCLGFEEPGEIVDGHLASFELGPCVGVRIGGVERADDANGQPGARFVASKRLERRGEDDAAEVPQHGLDGKGLSRSLHDFEFRVDRHSTGSVV